MATALTEGLTRAPASDGKTVEVKRADVWQRWSGLQAERSTWWSHWSDLSQFLLPRSGRFFVADRNRGQVRHNQIYDSTGTRALRVLAAGMMSGMTSPARPWFKLSVSDATLKKVPAVKVWLNACTIAMRSVFERSNTYRSLHQMYEELGAFGTAATIVVPHPSKVIHHYPLTCGEYAIATNWRGEVDTLYRAFQKTVRELITEFGYENCTPATRALYDKGALETWTDVIHAIEPRTDRDPSLSDAKNMPWKSLYFEPASQDQTVLRDSGFNYFNVLAPRWAVSGGDVYGNGPGMEALGDIKQLQQEQLRKGQAIDYQTKPPLQVPTMLKGQDAQMLPGGITFYDAVGPGAGIRTAFEVKLDLNALLMDIQDVRSRVNGSFYADLFLMLANQTDTRMTATEVAERHEEKLLMLGPVLERLQNEMLDPLIQITFTEMMARGMLPPPPREMQGSELNVQYVSMLAQAQQAVGVNSIDRFVGAMTQIAETKRGVLDKFDQDKWADIYADILGVDPELIVSDDDVAKGRAAQAAALAKQQAAEQAPAAATAAQKLSQVNPQGLQDVMQQFSGYTTPQGA